MVKSELIQSLCEKLPSILPRDVELGVNCILEQMAETLENGERIEVRNFGSFNLKYREPRKYRNPKTGEPVYLSARSVAHFKPSVQLRDRVNSSKEKYPIQDL